MKSQRKLSQNAVSVSQQDSLWSSYLEFIQILEQGDYEGVSQAIHSLRHVGATSEAEEAVRRLISARIAIKRGQPPEDASWLDLNLPDFPWIHAESRFVLGLRDFHLGRFESGAEHFKSAQTAFCSAGLLERELLASYNAYIGGLHRETEPSIADQLRELKAMEREVVNGTTPGCRKVQAMIHRRISYIYEEDGRTSAALAEIERAIELNRYYGAQSDWHLSLLHAADLCLDLQDPMKAKMFYEQVMGPVDTRVEFPWAYLRWRMFGESLKLETFSMIPAGWKEKYERLLAQTSASSELQTCPERELIWKTRESVLLEPARNQSWTIKPSSVEGRLIRAVLTSNRASRAYLTDLLWPEQNDPMLLDNRLHGAISRLNRKLGQIISFDGRFYRIQGLIRLE